MSVSAEELGEGGSRVVVERRSFLAEECLRAISLCSEFWWGRVKSGGQGGRCVSICFKP